MPLYKTFDVIPEAGSWLMRTGEGPGLPRRHDEKEAAVREAVRLALGDRPSQVVVYSSRNQASQCIMFDVQDAGPEPENGDLEGSIEPPPPLPDERVREPSRPTLS